MHAEDLLCIVVATTFTFLLLVVSSCATMVAMFNINIAATIASQCNFQYFYVLLLFNINSRVLLICLLLLVYNY